MRGLNEIVRDLDCLSWELRERADGHPISTCMCPVCRAKFDVMRAVCWLKGEAQKEETIHARAYAENR